MGREDGHTKIDPHQSLCKQLGILRKVAGRQNGARAFKIMF